MISMNNRISILSGKAELAVILGSGMSPLEDQISARELISYSDIDILSVPTAKGHPGRVLLFQTGGGDSVYLFAGRSHLYEGVSMEQAGAGVFLASKLGCGRVLLVNAAGSLRYDIPEGSWLVPSDLLAFPFCREGHEEAMESPASFTRGSYISGSFRRRIIEVAREAAVPVHDGTLMWNAGPCYETSAEARAALKVGADAVTMSIMPELAASLNVGIETAVLSWITNYTPNVCGKSVTHDEVLNKGKKARQMLFKIIDKL